MAIHNKPVSLGGMFKRSGAWFALFPGRSAGLNETPMYLGTLRGMAQVAPDRNRLINVFPTFNGKKVTYELKSEPAELTLVSKYGNVRFTFADTHKLYAEGDPGMGLLLEKQMVQHETVHPRKGGAWEAYFRLTCGFIFKGLDGSTFDFNDGVSPWNWEKLTSDRIYGRTRANADGRFTLMMEEFTYTGFVRDEYPSYPEAKASMQADWDKFIEGMPAFGAQYEDVRENAEYLLWSFLTEPSQSAHHTMIQMFAGVSGSQWQMCQNAVALQEHVDLAVDLLLGPIQRANEYGQMADMFDDMTMESLMVKPPMHGWAVKQIMQHHDLAKEASQPQLERLYTGMSKWADWFTTHRDDDGDGLPSIFHPDETGLDDCTLFVEHQTVSSPDIAAYLVLLYEANGDLAKLLGKPEAEVEAWYAKSKSLLQLMIDELWDGERFAGLVPGTREKITSGSVVHYMPAVLGDRLPKEIIDKLADGLSDPNTFLTDWGIASESKQSELFTNVGFGKGAVLPPVMLFICTGLRETHRREDARMFAERYCAGQVKQNFAFFLDSTNGMGLFGVGSWSVCAFVTLARMLNEK